MVIVCPKKSENCQVYSNIYCVTSVRLRVVVAPSHSKRIKRKFKVDPNDWTVFSQTLASKISLGTSVISITQA